MPDLTVEIRNVCRSKTYWRHEINQYTVTYERQYGPNRRYEYDYQCTCKGFQFHRHCKHIDIAKEHRCGWGASLDQSDDTEECPKCGGPTEFMRVGV